MNQNTDPTPRDGLDVTEQEALPGTDKTERVPQHYAAGNKAKPTRRCGNRDDLCRRVGHHRQAVPLADRVL